MPLRALLLARARAVRRARCTRSGFGVATWNLGWLMDAATHARWAEACGKLGWPAGYRRPCAAARATLAGLPYLRRAQRHDVSARRVARRPATAGRMPRATPPIIPAARRADLARARATSTSSPRCAPCSRASTPTACASSRCRKCSMRARCARSCRRSGRWSTTRELPGTPAIAQQVGIAWGGTGDVRDIDAVTTLADSGFAQRPLRPGLAFTVDVGGKPVRALVVHLKAGCRSRDLDMPLTTQGCDAARRAAGRGRLRLRDAALPAAGARGVDRCQRRRATSRSWATSTARCCASPCGFGDVPDAPRRQRRRRIRSAPARSRATATGGPCAARPARARCFPSSTTARRRARCCGARGSPTRRGGAIASGRRATAGFPARRGDLTHDGIDHVLISASLKDRLTPDGADAARRELPG